MLITYNPITNKDKQQWIDYLQKKKEHLDGKEETKDSSLFNDEVGDVATAKDLVGNLLALLTCEPVIIN